MLCVNAPPKKAQEGGGSEVFQELKGICIALGMSKPPANITMFQFFSGIEKKVRSKGTKPECLRCYYFNGMYFCYQEEICLLWKFQCLNCDGLLGMPKVRILKMNLKAFSMPRHEVRTAAIISLKSEVFLTLLQVLMSSLVADIENAEHRPQKEHWEGKYFKIWN